MNLVLEKKIYKFRVESIKLTQFSKNVKFKIITVWWLKAKKEAFNILENSG